MGLPLELIFLIVSHLCHDVGALRACALVCQDLRETSQRSLFNSHPVLLTTVARLLELVQTLSADHERSLADYITHLWVDAEVASSLHHIQGRLPRLRTLAVENPKPLEYGDLGYLAVDPAGLSAFTASCPALEELSLDSFHITSQVRHRQPSIVAVRSLVSKYFGPSHLNPLRGLLRELFFPHLESAHITIFSDWDFSSLGISVLLSFYPNLQAMHIDFSGQGPSAGACYQFTARGVDVKRVYSGLSAYLDASWLEDFHIDGRTGRHEGDVCDTQGRGVALPYCTLLGH
jgi:hypothetical protein